MVKMGSINMAKAIRRIGHRTGQARKMTFYRDAITAKDDYGVQIDTIASGNEGLTIPNIDVFIAPIVTSSDTLTRAGHTVIGSANLYIPSLSTIKNNILGIDDDGPHSARLSSFNELESKDILYDMEKVLNYQAEGDPPDYPGDYSDFGSNDTGRNHFEGDRIQFKVKNNSSTGRMTTLVLSDNQSSFTDSTPDTHSNTTVDGMTSTALIKAGMNVSGSGIPAGAYVASITSSTAFVLSAAATTSLTNTTLTFNGNGTLTWTFDDTSNPNFNNTKYHIIDLPVSGVSAGDKAYYIYVPASGAVVIKTLTATIANNFDIKECDGETRYLQSLEISAASGRTSFTSKDFYLYKSGEWRINAIKEYRDEYMKLGCTKIRGERGSRRRAY